METQLYMGPLSEIFFWPIAIIAANTVFKLFKPLLIIFHLFNGGISLATEF